ncbi:sulfonate ABC transporter substrate-binding protein [Gloeothece verrucosa]|uniref:Putative aliphatic sulfonates-binding protein n=1 Tax=Gloeothece verrucosa (strain PCC 7822) TaxID=497965 RepID=E0UFL2_GLOV7|nr:sulfonate ABC transporter substrate-binding protein [Gloeothece verrucosa]ADN13123.1 aliphatic sulfonates family ABC transporter, periplasmic ligand-binding protein [Gloeothece verrucosa PCC 7822]
MLFGNLRLNLLDFWVSHKGAKGAKKIIFLVIVGIILTACSSTQTNLPVSSSSPSNPVTNNVESKVIRIGYQKFGTLNILKARGNLEQRLKGEGISVQWLQFPAGPQLLEALNAGSIDFGHTGEAPPIFAQAAGAPLVYVASQTPNPKAEGILVKQDSPLKTLADLKGKKVVLNKGSNVHFFLVKALEKAGLKYEDINIIFLPPADARAAFEQGSVDAWAIWDPFFTAAKRATGARVLEDGEGIVANREFYLAAKPFVEQYPERVKTIIEETKKADSWAKTNVTEAATLLAPELGLDVPTLEEVLKRRPGGIEPINGEITAYQQQIADTFLGLKLLPKPIQVKDLTEKSN